MVRLILVLAPIMCILGSIGVSGVLSTFMANIDNEESHKVVSKSTGIASSGSHKTPKATADPTYPFKSEVSLSGSNHSGNLHLHLFPPY